MRPLPPFFARRRAVRWAAVALLLAACERRSPPAAERSGAYVETGALSMHDGFSSRQVRGTYTPLTGRFTPTGPLPRVRDCAVMLLGDHNLTVEEWTGAGASGEGTPAAEPEELRDEVHELSGAGLPRVNDFTYYASDEQCQPNKWFGAPQRLEYRWARSCLLVWSAPIPSQWGVASRAIPRPATLFFFDREAVEGANHTAECN